MAAQDTPGTRFCVCENMTIYHAAVQKEALLEALKTAAALDLDLSAVSEIDTAGLQLLMLVKSEGERLGKPVRISAHSQAVQETLEFCRLAANSGDPLLIFGETNASARRT